MENAMDGNLSAKVDEHLTACASCREAYERFNATVMMLDEIPEVNPPADFHASVMARVERTRRRVPETVRWWRIDWQHVFTIRVPARAAVVGLAVVLLFAMAFQLFPPLRGGIAIFFGLQRPSAAPIHAIPEGAPRGWLPWNSNAKDHSGLLIDIAADRGKVYSIRLGTKGDRIIGFGVKAAGNSYSGFVGASRDTIVKVPAPPAGSVAEAEITWSDIEQDRVEHILLPAKLEPGTSPRSFTMQNVRVEDVLRKVCREYGVAIIASGDLKKPVSYAQVDRGTPYDALYYCLESVGMKARALSSTVFAVEPVR